MCCCLCQFNEQCSTQSFVDNHSAVLHFCFPVYGPWVPKHKCWLDRDHCYNGGNWAAQWSVLFIHVHSFFFLNIIFFINGLVICTFPKGPFSCAAKLPNNAVVLFCLCLQCCYCFWCMNVTGLLLLPYCFCFYSINIVCDKLMSYFFS